jgi:predicted lipid-binding transport protein (Tim44 family)
VVAVAPGAAPPDQPSPDGGLESLFEERVAAGPAPARIPAGPAPAEPRATTIDLSGGIVPLSSLGQPRPGAVPLRRIIGARASSGRMAARVRRVGKVGGWLAGTATVGAGLLALWVLLFSTISGGDVWLGRPVPKPAKQEQLVENSVTAPVTPAARATTRPPPAAKTVAPTARAGSAGPTSGHGGTGSGSGRNGADDPPGDDSGGTRVSTAPAGDDSGSSGSGSGGSGSSGSGSGSGSSGSGGGSGRGGSDD